MPDQPFDAAAYIDRTSAMIGLELDSAHRPGVVAAFERLANFAGLVIDFPLTARDEASPKFSP